ncbi:MAG: toprim domain-containing protein [DPANN group archaeon]|nr:toprim domain-containing protein [DPANN group archaeon]
MMSIEEWKTAVNASEKAIVVEGKNDEKALREMGIANRIYQLSRKAIFAVIEEVWQKERQVIILTDLDKEGKKLYGRLSSGLQDHGVEIDNVFREWLFRNSQVRQVEGLKL